MHDDPSNNAVKPSIESLEGRLTLLVVFLTALSSAVGVFLAQYPEDPTVKIVALVVAAALASLSSVTALLFSGHRTALKKTVAEGAAAIAVAKFSNPVPPQE